MIIPIKVQRNSVLGARRRATNGKTGRISNKTHEDDMARRPAVTATMIIPVRIVNCTRGVLIAELSPTGANGPEIPSGYSITRITLPHRPAAVRPRQL
jgi:hypothetical protein